jgi:hypothetical protein
MMWIVTKDQIQNTETALACMIIFVFYLYFISAWMCYGDVLNREQESMVFCFQSRRVRAPRPPWGGEGTAATDESLLHSALPVARCGRIRESRRRRFLAAVKALGCRAEPLLF